MTNSKMTKRALLTSVMAVFLCLAMLSGTTFAWFTDQETSANNKILAGNLDIEFEYWNGTEWKAVQGASDILTNDRWEPGVTEVAYLRMKNAGSLALKYQLGINIASETAGVNKDGASFKLSDYIMYGVVEGVNGETNAYTADAAGRAAAIAAVTNAEKISVDYVKDGEIAVGAAPQYIAFVVYMPTDVDNKVNHNGTNAPEINIGISIVATQLDAEMDAFGPDYDKDSLLPVVNTVEVKDTTVAQEISVKVERNGINSVSVIVPANSANQGDVFELTVIDGAIVNDTENYTKSVNYNITLTKNGVPVDTAAGVSYPVTISVEPGSDVSKVLHNGVEISPFDYDPVTGLITFETDSFSPFTVVFATIPDDAVVTVVTAGKKKYYSSLNDAAKELTDGAALTLMNDVVLEDTLDINKSVTLDLGGFTVGGELKTLVKISGGEVVIKNGKLSNEHEAATETKYSVYVTGNAIASITDVAIATSGTGIYLDSNARITELNAEVSSYHTANGTCAYDAVSVEGNARIDLISGGEYISYVSDSYIDEWNQTHSYSGTPSYALRINSANASVGKISGGKFLSGDDRSNCGAVIYVNSGELELISGGYFGFAKFGLQSPWKILFVNTSNGASLGKVTGGTYEVYTNRYGCDFAGIVDASGCKIVDTGVDEEVKAQFSTSIKSYVVDVYEVVAK